MPKKDGAGALERGSKRKREILGRTRARKLKILAHVAAHTSNRGL